jgi:hypothetical protein
MQQERLNQLIADSGDAGIIFSSTKRNADQLARELAPGPPAEPCTT